MSLARTAWGPQHEGVKATDADIVVIDFETTGTVQGHRSEPWQVGMVHLRSGRIDTDSLWTSFIRVGSRPFSPHAPGNWMGHLDEIAKAPTLHDLWPTLHKRLGAADAVAAHAVPTERTLLRRAAPLHRFPVWVDTLTVARFLFPDAPSHTLEDLTKALELDGRVRRLCPGRAAHDALYDAVAAAALLEHCLALPGWDQVTLSALAGVRAKPVRRKARRPGA